MLRFVTETTPGNSFYLTVHPKTKEVKLQTKTRAIVDLAMLFEDPSIVVFAIEDAVSGKGGEGFEMDERRVKDILNKASKGYEWKIVELPR